MAEVTFTQCLANDNGALLGLSCGIVLKWYKRSFCPSTYGRLCCIQVVLRTTNWLGRLIDRPHKRWK